MGIRVSGLIALGCALLAGSAIAETQEEGYLLLGPQEERRVKKFSDGRSIVAYHQSGSVVSEGEGGPWEVATFFAQGSMYKDAAGKVVIDVAVCEMADAAGDLSWSVLRRSPDGQNTIDIKAGTGRWKGIAGKGSLMAATKTRADGHSRPRWKMSWEIANRKSAALLGNPDDYKYHDQGLSFHGPHIKELSQTLTNGVTLLVSNQSGVLLSDDKEAKSPRNFATCFDRGTTYIVKGENLGDVMLLEDTDPDGDVVWLYHEWWYGKGPGSYEFIDGVGKWTGISGYGKTLGMLRPRTDDHFMLKSEMHWNLPDDQ
jgi:hypothetical protein